MLGFLKWLSVLQTGPKISQLKWAVSSWMTLATLYLRDLTDSLEALKMMFRPDKNDLKSTTGTNMENGMQFIPLLVAVPVLQVVLFTLLLLQVSLLVVQIVLGVLFSPVSYALYKSRYNLIQRLKSGGPNQQTES